MDLPFEIKVSTAWAELLDLEPPAPIVRQVGDHEVWLVESLFSPGECRRLLEAAEQHGFGRTNFPQAYRGNLRLTTTDLGLSEVVWERLRPLVPGTVHLEAGARMAEEGAIGWRDRLARELQVKEGIEESDEEALMVGPETWDAHGLNEVWRLAKYRPGDRFMQHCDERFPRNLGVEESMLTVNIYMNEAFLGGNTRFFFRDRPEPDFEVVPKTGLCLLFRQPPGQHYYHDGEEVLSGFKYLFRTDVMYRNRA